jgi:hypothetical protein
MNEIKAGRQKINFLLQGAGGWESLLVLLAASSFMNIRFQQRF